MLFVPFSVLLARAAIALVCSWHVYMYPLCIVHAGLLVALLMAGLEDQLIAQHIAFSLSISSAPIKHEKDQTSPP